MTRNHVVPCALSEAALATVTGGGSIVISEEMANAFGDPSLAGVTADLSETAAFADAMFGAGTFDTYLSVMGFDP